MTLPRLSDPELVDPPACACRGTMPQAREHTRHACSVLRTDELNALASAVDEDRPLSIDEEAIVVRAGVEISDLRAAGTYEG